MFVALGIIFMIYGLGHWAYKSFQQAARERSVIRDDLTDTTYRINAYFAICDQFPSVRERHLRLVHEHNAK